MMTAWKANWAIDPIPQTDKPLIPAQAAEQFHTHCKKHRNIILYYIIKLEIFSVL